MAGDSDAPPRARPSPLASWCRGRKEPTSWRVHNPGDGPGPVGVTAGATGRLARSARPDARRPVVVQDQPGRGRPDHAGAAGLLPRTHRRAGRRQRGVARAAAHPQRGAGPAPNTRRLADPIDPEDVVMTESARSIPRQDVRELTGATGR